MRYILAIILALLLCVPAFAASDEERIYGDPVIIYNGDLRIGYNSQLGEIWIYDGSDHKVIVTVPALAADWTFTLPADNGNASEVLSTDGSGTTSWVVAGGGNTYEIIDADGDTTAYVDDAVPSDNDQFVVELATVERLKLSGGAITFSSGLVMNYDGSTMTWNNTAADNNFVVYGDTDTQLFWVDAGLDRVGISTNAPAFTLDVDGTFSANSIDVNDAYLFPAADGNADDVLVTNGAGTASWAANAAASDNDWEVNGTDLEPTTNGNDVVLTAGETIGISSGAAANEVMFFSVTADADSRFSITADGTLGWADGANPVDTTIYRSAADTLLCADRFQITSAVTTGNTLKVSRNLASGDTNAAVVNILQDNAGDDQTALYVRQDGTGVAGFFESPYVGVIATVALYGKNNNTSTGSYGMYGYAAGASGTVHGVRGKTDSTDNAAYGVLADQLKAGTWADFDERNSAASPRAANPQGSDGRLYCSDDSTFSFINDTGESMGYCDADGDTKIQVEEGNDDDKVRIDTGGTERVVIDSTKANFSGPVEASTKFIIDGTDGIDAASIVLITDVDFMSQQVKYRTLTWEGGILTICSAESAWTPAPLNP